MWPGAATRCRSDPDQGRARGDRALATRHKKSGGHDDDLLAQRTVVGGMLAAMLAAVMPDPSASAQSVEEFYKGKTLQITCRLRRRRVLRHLRACACRAHRASYSRQSEGHRHEHGRRGQPSPRQLAVQRRAQGRHRVRHDQPRRAVRVLDRDAGRHQFRSDQIQLDRQRQQRSQHLRLVAYGCR